MPLSRFMMNSVIAFASVLWMHNNNACDAVILESSDEGLYSIGLLHAQPWTSVKAMDDVIERINAQMLARKLINDNMYTADDGTPGEQSVVKRYNRIGGTIVMGRRK